MIINEEDLKCEIPNDIKIERFDMAISFYIVLDIDNVPHLVCYDYNPVWNAWYPFYDDINKTPILHNSKAKTFDDLINEHSKLMPIDIEKKIILAKNRFKELIGNVDIEVEKLKNFITYEIKYSKSANLHTIYKFYNFAITNASDVKKLINPLKQKCKLFNLNDNNYENLISNAKDIILKEQFKMLKL